MRVVHTIQKVSNKAVKCYANLNDTICVTFCNLCGRLNTNTNVDINKRMIKLNMISDEVLQRFSNDDRETSQRNAEHIKLVVNEEPLQGRRFSYEGTDFCIIVEGNELSIPQEIIYLITKEHQNMLKR